MHYLVAIVPFHFVTDAKLYNESTKALQIENRMHENENQSRIHFVIQYDAENVPLCGFPFFLQPRLRYRESRKDEDQLYLIWMKRCHNNSNHRYFLIQHNI